MERLHVFTLACLCTQVAGNPMMFYSQIDPDPDCNQHQSAYTSDGGSQNYQVAYQGAIYQAAAPSYQAAAPSYQAAAPSYQAAAPSYQAAAPSYQAAAPSYQAAAPSYQASAPSYQGASYPSYQGPSYQETLQAMIAEALRALCSIVQSTVAASKQEIAALASLISQKTSGTDCTSGDDGGSTHEDVQAVGEVSNSLVDSQGGAMASGSNSTLASTIRNTTTTTPSMMTLENSSNSTTNTTSS